MSIADAILIGLFVMAIVFAVLVALSFIIDIISFLVKRIDPVVRKPAMEAAQNKAPIVSSVEMETSRGMMTLNGVDERTAAMVMAIISDELKTPLSQLEFVSIKAVD